MESKNLTPEDQRLAGLLRSPALSDDGFSHRVLAALPAPRQHKSYRWLFVTLGTLGGVALAIREIGSWTNVAAGLEGALVVVAPFMGELANPLTWLALGITTATVAYALLAPGSSRASQ